EQPRIAAAANARTENAAAHGAASRAVSRRWRRSAAQKVASMDERAIWRTMGISQLYASALATYSVTRSVDINAGSSVLIDTGTPARRNASSGWLRRSG